MLKALLIIVSAISLLSCAANQTSADRTPAPVPSSASPAPQPSTAKPGRQTGQMCGGIAGLMCSSDKDYCAMPEGTCKKIADAAGTCKPKPEMCPMIYAPVCGCDGNTYSNSCVAAAHGASVAAKGACGAT